MKQGLDLHLAVTFDGLALDDTEKIEFVFCLRRGAAPFKMAVWPGEVERKPNTDTLLIPWTKNETYKVDGNFVMDTRVTLKGTTDQPTTPIVQLYMADTLFAEGAEQ